jgi:hypothetical protein
MRPPGPWHALAAGGLAAQPVPGDRAEAERAFALAEQLGSVNAAAAELGTTWPSLRKAFARHGLGMPARNPEAVRQRAVAAARQRTGQPATPTLDPVFVALNPDALPARERSPAELYQWVRREEQYATLGANVVVELNSESRARRPTTRAWAIIAAPNAPTATRATVKAVAGAGMPTVPPAATAPADPTNPRSGGWLPMPADPHPAPKSSQRRRTARSSSLSGFCTQACFCRIAPATWANDAPVATVANRSAPMGVWTKRGPSLAQRQGGPVPSGRGRPSALRSSATRDRIGRPGTARPIPSPRMGTGGTGLRSVTLRH